VSDDLGDRLTDQEARVDALNRARTYLQDRVDELEAENERLRERVADLDSRGSSTPIRRPVTTPGSRNSRRSTASAGRSSRRRRGRTGPPASGTRT
jgi:predicted RNase H-like nuclease (RuvC/YqgF family)